MSKRLLAVFLVLCMLASVFGTVAFAAEPIYTTSAIKFGYVTGEAWTDAPVLEAGKTLTSKIEVSKTGGAESMIFALVVYDSNKLVNADSTTKSVAGENVPFEVSVKLPEDITNTRVVAVLWDNVTDMTAIANSSIFPGGSTDLESLTVDGEVIAGFSPDVYEYEYKVNVSRENLPVVEAKAVDGGATVEVIDPTDFPGKTQVVVTAPGGDSATYTIKYTADTAGGFVTDLMIMTDNVIPQTYGGGVARPLASLVVGGLTVGSKGYNDRDYFTTEIHDESLIGKDKIIGGIGWYNSSSATATAFKSAEILPWVNFTLTRGATVMVFFADSEVAATPRFAQYGYKLETNTNGYFTNTLNDGVKMKHIHKFYRHYKAGEVVTVPNATQGNNTYTIVLSYDPIGYVAPTEHTSLSSISINGKPVEDFDADTLTYNVKLPYGTTSAVVDATAKDSGATVSITQATSLPGTATITVSAEGSQTVVYIVNITVAEPEKIEPVQNVTMKETFNGEPIDWRGTKIALYKNNLQVGDLSYSDKSEVTIASVDPSLAGKDWIQGALGWANDGSYAYFGLWRDGNVHDDFFTFDLYESAMVRIVTDYEPAFTANTFTALANSGYTKSINDSGYITTSNGINYPNMYSKYYTVEDGEHITIGIPNLGSSACFVIIDCDAEKPLVTTLSEITVNGKPVEDFDEDTLTYNVELPYGTTSAVVDATATDSGATVSITQATSLPGTATITASAEGSQTVMYIVNITVAEPEKIEPVQNVTMKETFNGEPIDWRGTKIAVYKNNLQVGDLSYSDKSVTIASVDPSLAGKDWIQGALGWANDGSYAYFGLWRDSNVHDDFFTFDLYESAIVRIITDYEPAFTANTFTALADAGYTKSTNDSNYITTSNGTNYPNMYSKYYTVEDGEHITIGIPNLGSTACFVIIDCDAEKPPVTTLSEITVNGDAVKDFDADTLTYDVELPYGTTSAVVDATATDSGATVSITQATSLPGTATITVSAEGSQTVMYIVNITVAEPEKIEPVQNVTMKETFNGEPIDWRGTKIAVYKNNLQVGDLSYSDKSVTIASVDPSLAGKDWIQGALGWANDGSYAYFGLWRDGNVHDDFFTFDLYESAMVRIITDYEPAFTANTFTALADAGYTKSTNDSNYITTSNGTNYPNMYSKYYTVEDGEHITIGIPNLGSTACFVIIDCDAMPTVVDALD